MSKKKSVDVFIKESKNIHGNKYDYSKVEYVNTHTKVCIICPKHGEFWQEPNSHLHGRGCPECGKEIQTVKRSKSLSWFIQQANLVHGDKYDYSKVDYVNTQTKVCIICPKHGEFWQSPSHHLYSKSGCPRCGVLDAHDKVKLSFVNFINRANEIHNFKFDYSNVIFLGLDEKVEIVCPEHRAFWQTPRRHLNSLGGCPICKSDKLSSLNMKSLDVFISDAQLVHGNKYNYSKVQYLGKDEKVCIICPGHGEFWQTPHDHLLGCGCPKCAHIDSSYEEYLYENLVSIYTEKDIFREYDGDKRYPFKCDFYIKSIDLFIEVNGFWTHNDHWFNSMDKNDLEQLKEWEGNDSNFYKSAIRTWTVSDIKKREHARKNNLNYVVLWTMEDIDEWFSEGCPIRKDWI